MCMSWISFYLEKFEIQSLPCLLLLWPLLADDVDVLLAPPAPHIVVWQQSIFSQEIIFIPIRCCWWLVYRYVCVYVCMYVSAELHPSWNTAEKHRCATMKKIKYLHLN